MHGLALVAGPERVRERGVGLLLRAVEMREGQWKEFGGTRELLSAAHENYARGLLAVHRAGEALEYLELALRVHQEEYGHGSWRTRGILLQKFQAFVELSQLDNAEFAERTILKLDSDTRDWARYTQDALWLGEAYAGIVEIRRATKVLRAGRARAVEHRLVDDVAHFDRALEELEVK